MTVGCQRLAVLCFAVASRSAAQEIPSRIADTTYWRMVTEFSEPTGYFPSDNLLSNEWSLQYVIPQLLREVKQGGVYLGVAPEQNFTLIAAMKPKIAFMVDIRHDNSLLLLVYKSLFELSADRAEFASRLFSRPRPANLDTASTALQILQALGTATKDSTMFLKNLAEIKDRLLKTHGFPLSKAELESVEYLYWWFYNAGPNLRYNMNQGGGYGRFPTYMMLMTETDGAGEQRAYLANERNFRVVKEMEEKNLIIGVTGDFTGPKALRAVGDWVRARHATITAFYVSNVEFYLYRQGDDPKKFYANVKTLPLDETSTFIRSLSQGFGFRPGSPNGQQVELLCPIQTLLKANDEGKVPYYMDMINLCK